MTDTDCTSILPTLSDDLTTCTTRCYNLRLTNLMPRFMELSYHMRSLLHIPSCISYHLHMDVSCFDRTGCSGHSTKEYKHMAIKTGVIDAEEAKWLEGKRARLDKLPLLP